METTQANEIKEQNKIKKTVSQSCFCMEEHIRAKQRNHRKAKIIALHSRRL